ncbi:MAG: hypothetical protein HQK58_11395, partial [Deltaproteobacteria bacterium]|nr:hypothetical protein [Deltaproteobacteria bacterium]
MKKCSKCLKEFESQFAFCPQCGGPLSDYGEVQENEAAATDDQVMLDGKIRLPGDTGTSAEPSAKGPTKEMEPA